MLKPLDKQLPKIIERIASGGVRPWDGLSLTGDLQQFIST